MPITIKQYDLSELSHKDSKNQLFIRVQKSTMIDIEEEKDKTIISFPFGNKFDIIGDKIIIHQKFK